MLGQDLAAAAKGAGHDVVAFARAELDIVDGAAIEDALRDTRPRWSSTARPGRTSTAPSATRTARCRSTAPAPATWRGAAAAAGAWTIHVSSDYVFDGSKRSPYLESDPVGPLSVVRPLEARGRAGGRRGAPERHTIVRSSWLFGPGGPCFPATIRRLASERDELKVVDDQIGCPTFTGHLAQALVELAARESRTDRDPARRRRRDCSWYEFAREIVAVSGVSCGVKRASTAELPRPAARPAYSVLRSERDASGAARLAGRSRRVHGSTRAVASR